MTGDPDQATIEALGKASEALECVERARGALYTFHQLMGHADLLFGDAADLLRRAGHGTAAEHLDRDVVGRNAIDGRWTFQIVEEFDDSYYDLVREFVRALEADLAGGRRHVYERQMKEERRTVGMPGHERVPADVHGG